MDKKGSYFPQNLWTSYCIFIDKLHLQQKLFKKRNEIWHVYVKLDGKYHEIIKKRHKSLLEFLI